MRRGRHLVSAFWIAFCACSSAPPPAPPARAEPPARPPEARIPEPDPAFRFPDPEPVPPPQVPGGEGIKGAARVSAPAEKREPAFEDVLKLQKEVAARRPADEDEKLRLALLHAASGNLEEAERIVASIRNRSSRLLPYVELYLRRELGDHPSAAKLLAGLVDEERRAQGFAIERAALCQKIRRYRDYTPAESDRVAPGGVVLLYVEPRNFTLQKSQEKHVLHLKYEWKLLDDRSVEQPIPAWERASAEEREDRLILGGPVSEFYQSFKLPLPANLAMGHYRIQVKVTDAHTGKSDQAGVPIYVPAVERRP